MMNSGDNRVEPLRLRSKRGRPLDRSAGIDGARKLAGNDDTGAFDSGLASIGEAAKHGQGIERLVAVDLLMRLAGFVKKMAPKIESVLSGALQTQIPPLGLLEDSDRLPDAQTGGVAREYRQCATRRQRVCHIRLKAC